VVPLAELEPTRAADLPVPMETTPGLEPTRFEAVASLGDARVDGLEPTLSQPVEVALETTPDLEPTRVAEEEPPSLFPLDVPCPNCGQAAPEEQAFCPSCGMHLPRIDTKSRAAPSIELVCSSCGGQSFSGGMCQRCGVRQPSAP